MGLMTYSTFQAYPRPGKPNILHVIASILIFILATLYTFRVITERNHHYLTIKGVRREAAINWLEEILKLNHIHFSKHGSVFQLHDALLEIQVGTWFVGLATLFHKRRAPVVYISLGPINKEDMPFIQILKESIYQAFQQKSYSPSQKYNAENSSYFRISDSTEDYKKLFQPGDKVIWCRQSFADSSYWGTKAIVLEKTHKRVKIQIEDFYSPSVKYVKPDNLIPEHLVLWGDK